MKGLILTYLIAYGGAVAALFYPLAGVWAYAFLSIARPQLLYGWSGDLSGLSRIVAVALAIGWGLKGFGRWSFGRIGTQVYLLIAFFAWMSFSAFFAPNQDLAWDTVFEQVKFLLPFIVSMTMIRTRREVMMLAWAIVLSQGLVSFEMNWSYLSGYNRAQAEGLLGDNNTFAVSLVTTLGPALFLGLLAPKLWQKGVAFLCAAMILHTILLTYSRGAILAMIVSGVLCLMVMPKKPTYLAAVVLAALIAIRLTGPQLLHRFESSFAGEGQRDSSAESRLKLWQDCITVMERNPILGVGPSHWPTVASQFGWIEGKAAHTFWLQLGAEIGVPGLLFLVLFYVTSLWRAWQLARRRDDLWLSNIGCYTFTGLGGFMFAAQFVSASGIEVPYYVAIVGLTPFLLTDLPVQAEQKEKPKPQLPKPPRPVLRPGRMLPPEFKRATR